MTVSELLKVLNSAESSGHGNAEILFDSEAQHFRVHMIDIKSAHFSDGKESGMRPMVTLHYEWKDVVHSCYGACHN